jgi:chromosome condensin MukBEF ATPase and DNA-binding subunit MukB
VARQKQQLAEAQKELELLQRELALEQDNVYAKTNYASDTAGKAKLDDLKLQVADKQQALDALKARLEALLGTAATTAPALPPAPPQP